MKHCGRLALGLFVLVTCSARAERIDDVGRAGAQSLVASGALDVDGNGVTDALTDGILLMRYVFGVRGEALIRGVIGPGAARTTSGQIEAYLSTLAGAVGPVVPPGACEIRFSPGAVPAYQEAAISGVLSVYCAIGDAPTQCTWDPGIAATSCVVPFTPVGETTVTVIASNSGGASPPASLLVREIDWTYWPIYCIAGDSIQTILWPSMGAVVRTTSDLSTQTIAFKLTVPQNISASSSGFGTLSIASTAGGLVIPRDVTVSSGACDFRSGQYLFASIGAPDSPIVGRFTVNNPTGYTQAGAQFNVNAGDTIYINLRNTTAGIPSCPTPPCNATVEWTPPPAQ